VGDIGPGDGLVFLISDGKTFEMADKAWSGAGNLDATAQWCDVTNSNIAGAAGTGIGTGSANTTAMQSPACSSGAGVSSRAYLGGGFTDWFLPSRDELNAMYLYSQVAGFDTATYGFATDRYWSSSQQDGEDAPFEGQRLDFLNGDQGVDGKDNPLRVRPIRAF
jgi:hypothetical protein